MYSSYEAAVFPRLAELARRRGIRLEGALTWAFEFEDQPPFAGFRQLTSTGIDLPVMNAFKLFARMRGSWVADRSDHQLDAGAMMRGGVRGAPDVGSTAALDGDTLCVLVWHYHDDDVAGPDAAVRIALRGLPAAFARGATVLEYRVDRDHANAYAAWRAMGSPAAPSDAQRTALLRAARLDPAPPAPLAVAHGTAALALSVPRQGVALLVVRPTSGEGRSV